MKAGTLYGYNLGIRDRYDYTTGVFNTVCSAFSSETE